MLRNRLGGEPPWMDGTGVPPRARLRRLAVSQSGWIPFSRATGAILRGHQTDPLVIETNSSIEYWQKGASLIHTDPTGRHDADLPPNVRVYLIAGTQHGGRSDTNPGPCANPRNPHSANPALRALFLALEEWVTKG